MKTYHWSLKNGIARTKGFEEKLLAQYAVNTGLKCGHLCTYCSTGTMIRTHEAFKELELSPFENNYALVDPDTPKRVSHDACRKRKRGLVQLCTLVDAWSPEAQKYDLGRRCLEAILPQPGWTVRILTKNTAVMKDFDVVEKYKSRILFGLSITSTPDKSNIMTVVEPNASCNSDRIDLLREAHKRGFRTFVMFCPLLPSIADSPAKIKELIGVAVDCGVEEIFVEAVNPRGCGLKLTQEALKSKGYHFEAAHIDSIRYKENWSWYATRLIKNIQKSVRQLYDIRKLRFLLYASRLESQDIARIKQDDAGVIWLGKS